MDGKALIIDDFTSKNKIVNGIVDTLDVVCDGAAFGSANERELLKQMHLTEETKSGCENGGWLQCEDQFVPGPSNPSSSRCKSGPDSCCY